MRSDAMLTHVYRVERVQDETYDTFTLDLASSHGLGLAPFAPGQFNMLYAYGVGEVPISISGDPAKPKTLAHTIRAVGNVTKAMRKLNLGDKLGVRGPFGTSWPLEEAKGYDVVIVAGGIGMAPLRPSLYRLLSERREYGKVFLLYGARTPSDLLYPREFEQWQGRSDLEVHVTVDRALRWWRGNVGVVTTLIPKAAFDPTTTIVMVCGPEVMMRFTVAELQKRGVAEESIYISMERNMKCGFGFCGHCQLGPFFICKDGPVFRYDRIRAWLARGDI